MKNNRKQHSPTFKGKVALEALRERKSTSQLAQDFKIHPTQISHWKKQLREAIPDVFRRGKKPSEKEHVLEIQRLHQRIGELDFELDWLKKKQENFGE